MNKVYAFLLFCSGIAMAQNLTVGAASGLPGTIVRVPITLNGVTSTTPAALQWIMKTPKTTVISHLAGPVATSAAKDLYCESVVSTLVTTRCILVGMNDVPMSDGVVSYVDIALPASFSTVALGMSGVLGSNPIGDEIQLTAVSGKVTRAIVTTTLGKTSESGLKQLMSDEAEGGIKTFTEASCKLEDDAVRCNLLVEAREKGEWISPFTSRDDLFEVEPIWLEAGQQSVEVLFKFVGGREQDGQALVIFGVRVGQEENAHSLTLWHHLVSLPDLTPGQ